MLGLVVLIVLALAATPLLTPAGSTQRPQDFDAEARHHVLDAQRAEAGGRAIAASTLPVRR